MTVEKVVANLARKVERRFYGKYRGFVKKNEDPENIGRLLVTVPSVLGDQVAVWAFPCVPYGGMPNQGFLFIPDVRAGVWIEFEEGDPEFPIWVGTFWSKPGGNSELPKPNSADGTAQGSVQSPPSSKIIKTKKGHTIQLEDKDGSEMVIIVEAKNKHVITMDQNGIIISDKKGSNEIKMDGSSVTITSDSIKIGSSSAAEALVKGTSFKVNVATFIGLLTSHTHPTPAGPSSPSATKFELEVPLSTKHKTE
jgi:hypothetical protein